MSLSHVLLGFLSQSPASGYELKKLVAESPIMPWSGNSNQIYRSLLELAERGLAQSTLEEGEHGPARKIYAITQVGLSELRRWLKSAPEAPEIHNSLLWRLAWSNLLTGEELDGLLRRHEDELYLQLRMIRQRRAAAPEAQSGSGESLVADYVEDYLEFEMGYCRKARRGLERAGSIHP